MKINQATPIFYVDSIEAALTFWASLGWEKTVEVPHDGQIGFVILKYEDRELMLQTKACLAFDLPEAASLAPTHALYFDVPSLDEAKKSAKGGRVLVDERSTPYGAREHWVVDPSGVLIGFAEHQADPK